MPLPTWWLVITRPLAETREPEPPAPMRTEDFWMCSSQASLIAKPYFFWIAALGTRSKGHMPSSARRNPPRAARRGRTRSQRSLDMGSPGGLGRPQSVAALPEGARVLTEPELGMREVAVKCASTLAVLLAASACRATDAAPPAASADFEVLLSGSQSGEHRAGATLITNEEAWQAFWRRHSGWRIPPAPEPAVDFGVHSVIVLCAGDEPTGGWTLEARSIRHAQGELRV